MRADDIIPLHLASEMLEILLAEESDGETSSSPCKLPEPELR
jgi:hypothetical protein